MERRNIVYIAKSLDGYIADKDGGLDWLHSIPNPEQSDMGYNKFTEGIDALIMGRTTFETVCSFDCDWPYKKPVFVLSTTLTDIPKGYEGKVEVLNGSLTEIVGLANNKGYNRLYIDGGRTIQNFLKEDLIDELIITTIPVLLGGGFPLFSDLPKKLEFKHVESKVYLNEIVQNHYSRKR